MFDRRYEASFTIETLSPLHIGTGERTRIAGVGSPGANDAPDVARIVRDHRERPYLPATTLKGTLRRLAEGSLAPAQVERLFGTIKHSDQDTGAMGTLLFRGGTLDGEAPEARDYPYADRAAAELGRGVFVAARTAVDARSGTADDHKLFFEEMVVAGTRFRTAIVVTGPKGAEETDLDALLSIVARLQHGVPCGRGKADGSGMLRLVAGSLEIAERSLGADGRLGTRKRAAPSLTGHRPQPPHRWSATLRCEGPYLTADSSYDPEEARRSTGKDSVPQLVAQRGRRGGPLELGSQIAGALRSRARYLAGLQALERGIAARDIAHAVDPGAAGMLRVVRKRAEAEGLTPVERLFGVSGFAGLLSIAQLRFEGGTLADSTSVKLDHFSGAPIDKALFTSRAFVGTALTLALQLEGRGGEAGVGALCAADIALFETLTRDIEANGLRLGHGTARGFGWFSIDGMQGR